jgi:hypothetical protein
MQDLTSWETQVKVDGTGRRRSKEHEVTGWRVKAEDREEWSKIFGQTKIHPGL